MLEYVTPRVAISLALVRGVSSVFTPDPPTSELTPLKAKVVAVPALSMPACVPSAYQAVVRLGLVSELATLGSNDSASIPVALIDVKSDPALAPVRVAPFQLQAVDAVSVGIESVSVAPLGPVSVIGTVNGPPVTSSVRLTVDRLEIVMPVGPTAARSPGWCR